MNGLEAQFLRLAGESLGAFKHVSEDDKNRLKVELISEEALQTSKIEGEILDRHSRNLSSASNSASSRTIDGYLPKSRESPR